MKKKVVKTSIISDHSSWCCCGNPIWWGVFLIVIGAAWLLNAWRVIIPVLLIILGVFILLKSKKK